MRKYIVALITATLLVVSVAPATSAPSPEGTLNSAFNTWFTGGEATTWATFERGGEAWFHAASSAFIFDTFDEPGFPNSGIGAVRLSPIPGWPAGPFCDSYTFGIWVVAFGSKAEMKAFPDQTLTLNGEVLASKQTPVKPIFDPDGFWAEDGFESWFSFGVPVYGSLDAGTYDITWTLADGFSVTNTVEIASCP